MGLKQRVNHYPRMVDDVTLNCCSRAKNLFYFFFFIASTLYSLYSAVWPNLRPVVATKRNEMKYKYRQNQKLKKPIASHLTAYP